MTTPRVRGDRRVRPLVLGLRKEDLPAEMEKLSQSQLFNFIIPFFDAFPEVANIISSRVDTHVGRPRQLSVRFLLFGMVLEGIDGRMHVKDISRTLRSLRRPHRRKLGLKWEDPEFKSHKITGRQVEYLMGVIAKAFDPAYVRHNHLVCDEKLGLVVNPSTAQIFGSIADFGDASSEEFDCTCQCPAFITLEYLENKLVSDFYTYIGIPKSAHGALDSFPLKTFYRTRSHGGEGNIQANVYEGEDAALILDNAAQKVVQSAMIGAKSKKKWKTKSSNLAKKKQMVSQRSEWDRHEHPLRELKSRKPDANGPRALGDFTRFDPDYPQIAEGFRLQHSVDSGAGNGYQGAGNSRPAGIVNGRDMHYLVMTGDLPDGTPFPPFPMGVAARKAGGDKCEPAISTLNYATSSGHQITALNVNRGYTAGDIKTLIAPALKQGVDIVRDLTSHQQKCESFGDGLLTIDGYFFTNGTPVGLLNLQIHSMFASALEIEQNQAGNNARAAFACRPEGPMKNGKIRVRGPSFSSSIKKDNLGNVIAVGGYTARCVNSPYFHLMDRTVPQTQCTPADKGKCGCSITRVISMKDFPPSYEPKIYGTTKWYKEKGARSLVESYNALEQIHNGVDRYSIQVRENKWNLAHLGLYLALTVEAVYNWVCRLGAWAVDFDYYEPLDAEVLEAVFTLVTTPPIGSTASPPKSP
jgi:hypothetical protein